MTRLPFATALLLAFAAALVVLAVLQVAMSWAYAPRFSMSPTPSEQAPRPLLLRTQWVNGDTYDCTPDTSCVLIREIPYVVVGRAS